MEVEGINFHVGVDSAHNHLDPATYPSTHPLAPQNPSMHWGWAAGYRFIALEGHSGPQTNQLLQFHCIGDEFYEEMEYEVNSTGDNHIIELDADYAKLLSQIDVSSGLILHGNLNEIQTLAQNIKNKVFTVAELTSTEDSEVVRSFNVYPNPSTNGVLYFDIESSIGETVLNVNDAYGRTIETLSSQAKSVTINDSGLYFITLMDTNGNILATRKILVH